MDRRIPELVLLLILAIMGCMFAAAFNQWLFCANHPTFAFSGLPR
jgi:hypothetical protein